MSAKNIVLDASAALKWILRDEENISQADALLDDFLASRLDLLTTTLFDYEVTNALKVAVIMKRLKEKEAMDAIALFKEYEIQRYTFLRFKI